MKYIVTYDDMKVLLQMEYSKGRYDTITKAVEWLDEHLQEHWGNPNELFVEFKKAMEL